jgi:hypothetical protein
VLRSTLSVLLLAFAVQAAQAQLHGVPASASSPTSDGNGGVVLHGVPSSVTSPTPARNDRTIFLGAPAPHRRVHFGNPHPRPEHKFVPVPVFYPVYDYPADSAAPPVDQAGEANSASDAASSDDALQQAYNQGVRDATAEVRSDPRYGSHYLDSREKRQPAAARPDPKPAAASAEPNEEHRPEQRDNTPATVFIFKDGHKVETRSYAIVGQTLFDFSSSPLKKVPIADLDVDATRKANDDLGISLTLP